MLQRTKRAAVIGIVAASVFLAPAVWATPAWLDLAPVSATDKTGGWLWEVATWVWQRLTPSGEAGGRAEAPTEKDRWVIDPLGDESQGNVGEQGRWLIDPLG